MVYMYHSFLIHSSADGHLGCFHVLAIISSAAMNLGVHVSLSDLVSLVCMPRSGIAGSYGNVWQKPLQYCEVVSLQLIKVNEKKKRVRCLFEKRKIEIKTGNWVLKVLYCLAVSASLLLKKSNPWTGGVVSHKQWSTLPWGFWARASFIGVGRGNAEQGMTGQEVGDFLVRLADPVFC